VYGKILVPYDSSTASLMALEHAMKLAQVIGSHVIILHVIPEIPKSQKNPAMRPPRELQEELALSERIRSVYNTMIDIATLELEAKRKEYRTTGIGITIAVRVGHVVDSIVEFAKKEGVELVVISNVGSGVTSNKGMLGSVSRSVAERASCPVLIVRHSA
jgi:nucleotide-binding universal stress UspA family protein